MPIDYEFETVDCPLRLYASKREYTEEEGWAVEVVIQPESGIEQFDKRVAEYIYEVFEEELEDELDTPDSPVITHLRDPNQVGFFVVVRNDEVSVVDVGKSFGELLLVAEQRVSDSVDVDNGDFNLGAASALYDEE